MRVRRMIAIGVIFALACGGWAVLGTTTLIRTDSLTARLCSAVESLWGRPIVQDAPSLSVKVPGTDKVRWIMASANTVRVTLDLEHRRKGLIWYPTYKCTFNGTYAVTNDEEVAQKVHVHFAFPWAEGTYDRFAFAVVGEPIDTPVNTAEGVNEILEVAPGETKEFSIAYSTRGLREWRYRPNPTTGCVRGLEVSVTTNFAAIDFPEDCLSPQGRTSAGDGMLLTWGAENLITRQDIGVVMPEKLNPGPLSSRMTFFAPVCLLFFFVLIATINIVCGVHIHPMHYLFVAAGFFAFHLLFAYLVDHLPVHPSFAVAAITSVALVTAYLRAALGARFPWKIAGSGQLFYLVLFSYTFFLKGMTGLTVTIGSVATLGVLMAVTARMDWNEIFGGSAARDGACAQDTAPLPTGA